MEKLTKRDQKTIKRILKDLEHHPVTLLPQKEWAIVEKALKLIMRQQEK